MIKYIIFDFDGTLADSKAVFISVYNDIAQKHNYRQIDLENLQYLRTLTITDRCRYLKVPLYRVPFLAGEFLGLYKKSLDQIKLFEGIKEMLETLKSKDFQLAVISSNAENNIRMFLMNNGITSITQVYCSTSLFGKDELIKGFLKKYVLNKDDVLYIGDEVRDIQACKKAGIKVAWVEWGYELVEMAISAGPDYTVRRPDDIPKLVMGL